MQQVFVRLFYSSSHSQRSKQEFSIVVHKMKSLDLLWSWLCLLLKHTHTCLPTFDGPRIRKKNTNNKCQAECARLESLSWKGDDGGRRFLHGHRLFVFFFFFVCCYTNNLTRRFPSSRVTLTTYTMHFNLCVSIYNNNIEKLKRI